MAITVEVILQDVSTELSWRSLTIQESIGQPDTMSCELNEITTGITTLLGPTENYYYTAVYLDGNILFSGLSNRIRRTNDHGRVTYILEAVGWEFLAAKRLVGRPNGDVYEIQEDGDPDRLPTPVPVDVDATQTPTAGGVQALFAAYWNYPYIDTTTYVFDVLPVDSIPESVSWSGSDIDGAMNDLCAAGSAAAMWWIANDAPAIGNTAAPYLALHYGLIALPDDGDNGDDLLLGFPSADFPINVAPYAISDAPADWDLEIMAAAVPQLGINHDQRVDAVYVRGATGWVVDVTAAPPSFGLPYQLGLTHEGGTGWVGSYGGVWGEAYVDAPAAVSSTQRDAYGNAWLGAYNRASVSGTIPVAGGWHGWHKGQALKVTDAGLGLTERWLLIRGFTFKAETSDGSAATYELQVGDVMTRQLGYQLRKRRLQEQRKEIAPASRFIPYVGDLQLDPSETAILTMQLANDPGRAMAVAGVGAAWHLLVNGVDLADVEDTGALFYLTNIVDVTDKMGQVTATLNAGDVGADDAVKPWCALVLP